MKFPRIYLVRQDFPDRRLADAQGEARRRLEEADLASRVRPGARIAVGAGSRGIDNYAVIIKAAVDYWKAHGCKPFIFPAMGTHGGGTAEGQASVLAHYGVNEAAMGCPIVSSLEVVPTGRTPEGIQTFMDRNAYESDGVFLVGRVKWHTDFVGKIESGLCKMVAIGIGKVAGAQQYHAFGYRLGLERVIRSALRQVASTGKLVGGMAIMEDARHHTAGLAVVPIEDFERREEELLATVKSWKGRIPVDELDVLIVDEMGKDISGTGMDSKVINRMMNLEANCFPDAPRIHRIFVRDLTKDTYGNAIGMGMADIITGRLRAGVDREATYLNCISACTIPGIRTPIHFTTDRECLEVACRTVGRLNFEETPIGWITNTLELSLFAFSEPLLEEIRKNPALKVVSPPLEFSFDADGNLPPLVDLAAGAPPDATSQTF